MKRLLTILAFIIIVITSNAQQHYKPSLHAGPQNKPSGISSATPLDSRSYFYDTLTFSYRPYANRAEVLSYLYLASYRSGQFTIIIDSISNKWAFWFRNGTADSNLVLQYNFASATTDSSVFATLYRVDTAKVNLRASIAGKISTTLNAGQILVGNISNVATAVTPGNDVSVTSGGSFTVLNQWKLVGNAGTTDLTNFIGTTDNVPLSFKVNGFLAGRIDHLNANAFLGYRAGRLTTAANNSALGHGSLLVNTSGGGNTAIGAQSLFSSTFGSNNTSIGYNSLLNNTTGVSNTALGYNTAGGITTGNYNTIIGANITGLSAALNNNIILADGQGNKRLTIDSFGTPVFLSTTALGLPVGNTAQRPSSPVAGYLRFNTDSAAKETFDGSNWVKDGSGGGGGGSVVSVATNTGTGITGGTITSTGTLAIDTTNTITTKGSRQKLADSIGSILAGKQPTGNYITALTGDGTASGPGSAVLALTTVISAGSCTNCNLTYDAKGRLTVAGNGSGGTGGFNSNIGSGYRAAVPNTNNIKTFFPGYALVWDSISNANGLTISTDTTKISTITALNDSTDKFVYSTGFQTSGNTVYFFGHSYTFGTNASSPALRWSSLVAAGMGATEQNFGVAGKTLMLQNPKDYQGPNSMTQTLTDIPVKTFAMKALFFDFGLNDMGQTATDYSVANFKAAYDTVLNYAINTRGWFPSQIVIMGEEWIGTAGLNYYGTVTGNAAPTQTRAQQFVQAIKDEARKWGCKYVDNYYSILQNDTTLISGTGSVHPNDSGYAYIARRALQKLAVSTSTASSSTDSSLYVTTTRLATYVAAQAIANNPQLVQFTVGDNGEKTPANGVTTYQDSLLIGATGITVHQQGIGMPVGRARGGIYATFNDTTGTVTLHNGAFTDSAYFEMVGYFTTKAPQRTSDDSNFIAAVLGAGGSLTSLQEGYITTFFNTLKSNSLWDKIYAGHMLFLGSAAATKFNIKNAANTDAAYRITWHGTGTFASNGWTSDGSTGYGDFHFNPSLDATQDGLGLGAYVRGGSTGSTVYMMGNYDGSSITNDVGIDNSSGMFGGANSPLAQINSIIPAASTRLIYINRINSGSVKYYRDGAVVGTSSQTSATPYNGNIYLGCFNFGGTPSFFFGNRITFSIITDGSLNDTDEANLNTAINTFLTSWGINI